MSSEHFNIFPGNLRTALWEKGEENPACPFYKQKQRNPEMTFPKPYGNITQENGVAGPPGPTADKPPEMFPGEDRD